jgi:adenosine deaminase
MSWFDSLPKVELHVHLEGAIPVPALWKLIGKYGGDSSIPDLKALRNRFHYRSFREFLDVWVWKNGFLREYEDFRFAAEEVARDLVRQNVRYAEVFFSPFDFFRRGLQTQRLARAIRSGLNQVPDVRIRLITDLVWDSGPELADRTLSELAEVKDSGIVGVGMGGNEAAYPPNAFTHVYERARRLGFRTTVHAGETGGPENVWGAIRDLAVERIGHGVRSVGDPKLVDELRERAIPLEVSLSSNLRTGVVQSLPDHPLRQLVDAGIRVSINTDDPTMFNTTLANEYSLLESELGFSREEIRSLIEQGMESSWLDSSEKESMMARFRKDPAWVLEGG